MPTMKTAISIDVDLYRKAERLSAKLGVPRSRLFAQALEYLIEKSDTLEIIRKLNEVYGTADGDAGWVPKQAKRRLGKKAGKW
jgi:metal-responsive CopG/Arc/MetJ family transcriptional regulator